MKHLKFFGTGVWMAGMLLSACSDHVLTAEEQRGSLNSQTQVHDTSAATSTFKAGFLSNSVGQTIAVGLQSLNTGSIPVTPTQSLALPCEFKVTKINYNTVGAAGEAATATAAVMVPIPTGGNAVCAGPNYPVVLAAHGTTTDKAYDGSNILTYSESAVYAVSFAAQGYVVVAPNYAGYDQSSLGYHPYLILDQQVKDMRDAYAAANKAGLFTGNGKLYVTGYSQGGAVALATQRALEADKATITASAPNSGPYAMLSFGDKIFNGQPNRGGTVFAPLLIDASQKAYGNIYSTPSDLYNTPFSGFVTGFLPGQSLSTNANYGSLVQAALLTPKDASETGIFGIGSGSLINTATRTNYLADAAANPVTNNSLPATSGNPMRQALLKNDLRSGWVPQKPTQLCGADNDPTVYFDNTTQFQSYVAAKSATSPLVVLNLRAAVAQTDSAMYAALKQRYQASALNVSLANAYTATSANDVHSNMGGFCYVAAYGFFKAN